MGKSALQTNVTRGNALKVVCRGLLVRRLAFGGAAPLPVANFGQVIAVFGEAASVVEQFFAERLLCRGCARAQLGNAIDHITDRVEPVELVARAHVNAEDV